MLRKLLKYEFIFLIKDFSRIYIIYGIEVLILALLLLPFYLSVFDANYAVSTTLPPSLSITFNTAQRIPAFV